MLLVLFALGHGLRLDHKEAQEIVKEWSNSLHACIIKKVAVMSSMTYHCEKNHRFDPGEVDLFEELG